MDDELRDRRSASKRSQLVSAKKSEIGERTSAIKRPSPKHAARLQGRLASPELNNDYGTEYRIAAPAHYSLFGGGIEGLELDYKSPLITPRKAGGR